MKVTILINGKKYLHLVANFSKVQGLLLNYRFADQQIRVLFSEEEGDFTPSCTRLRIQKKVIIDTFSNYISSQKNSRKFYYLFMIWLLQCYFIILCST